MSYTLLHQKLRSHDTRTRCNLCTASIEVGETYQEQSATIEGRPFIWSTCTVCLDDRIPEEVALYSPEGYVTFEAACEWADDNHDVPEAQAWAKRARKKIGA